MTRVHGSITDGLVGLLLWLLQSWVVSRRRCFLVIKVPTPNFLSSFSHFLPLSLTPPLSLLPKHTPVASSAVHTTPKTEGKGLPTFGAFQGFQAAAPTSEKNDSDGSDKTGPTDLSRHLLVLHREVEMCEELLQLEPNCKWALLTVAFLLNGITLHGESVNGYAEKVGDTFSRLTSLDPLRTTYYRDMQTALLSSS